MSPPLAAPPGYRLLAFADFWFSRRQLRLVLRPVVRDLQEEVFAALAAEGRSLRPR